MRARKRAHCGSAPRSRARLSVSSCTCSSRTTVSAFLRRISSGYSKKDSRPRRRKPTTVSVCTGAPTPSTRWADGCGRRARVPGAAHRCICWCPWSLVKPCLLPELREVPMPELNQTTIRVLVVDDEPGVRDAYRQVLAESDVSQEVQGFRELRSRLFSKNALERSRAKARSSTTFEPVFCDQARAGVAAVKEALAHGQPFAVVFLDMRMPPGPDGVWAAARIRELDPEIEIVICTAYSDVDPTEIGGIVPPEEKLSYLQKPFHPQEVRHMTISLSIKWRSEHRIVKLAYFDALTGLPNREQLRNRLSSALAAARQHNRMLAVLYLDLDDFKRVNDTLGHAVGGELLCLVAARLRSSLRSDATDDESPASRSNHIGRLGGDEFIVILPNIRSADEAAA